MKSIIGSGLAMAMGASATVIRLNPESSELALKPRQSTACENSPTSRSCWGDYSIDTDYYKEMFSTGVTREYWLTLDPIDCAPDGYQRTCMAFNGTVPGPQLTADWGDNLKIHVTNNLQTNGTAIHWHGLRQLNSSHADGVPGVTECPIAPGTSKTYDFQVTQYGSTWYHSHFALQYAEGAFGGLVLNGPATADYDEDLGMLFLNDWSHTEAFSLWDEAKNAGPPAMENGLINGTNTFDCSASTDAKCSGNGTKWETVFEAGKKYRIRIINAATDGHFQFSIDGHNLTVIGNDLVPIVPYATEAVGIGMGQRYDIIVEANAASGDYWLRAKWNTACSNNQNPDGITGIVRYDSSSSADPTTVSTVTKTESCGDEPLTNLVPHLSLDVGTINEIASQSMSFATGGEWFQWTLNGSSLEIDWENPTLTRMMNGETEFPLDYNVVTVGRTPGATDAEFVVLVIEDDTGFGIYHPIHLHGHDFWVLGQDTGMWHGNTSLLNMSNPPRRDVATLPGNGYLAIAFELDNPGAWLVHCHIAWHASEGLAMEFVEDQSLYTISDADTAVSETQCANWNSYMNTTTYASFPKDDSGI
ncbi:laccase, multicopper oxidase, benzenediol:oxygen oxidorectuctase [Gnomoniopsis sp. IMI 355080]|nr:laccase, multicopper oxidase, benzenediol:oxygen oxidorectuctase [Gnomoniopsis sp. IMI 355080]